MVCEEGSLARSYAESIRAIEIFNDKDQEKHEELTGLNCIGKPDFAVRDLCTQELFESKMDQIGCMKKSFRTSLKKKKEHLKKTC